MGHRLLSRVDPPCPGLRGRYGRRPPRDNCGGKPHGCLQGNFDSRQHGGSKLPAVSLSSRPEHLTRRLRRGVTQNMLWQNLLNIQIRIHRIRVCQPLGRWVPVENQSHLSELARTGEPEDKNDKAACFADVQRAIVCFRGTSMSDFVRSSSY